MALHHKLRHTLGGRFDLPHAETRPVILPHAVAHNEGAAVRELAPITGMFGGRSPGQALHDFVRRIQAPTALRDIGMTEADLDRAAGIALQNRSWSPRPIEAGALRHLLQKAWVGTKPAG